MPAVAVTAQLSERPVSCGMIEAVTGITVFLIEIQARQKRKSAQCYAQCYSVRGKNRSNNVVESGECGTICIRPDMAVLPPW